MRNFDKLPLMKICGLLACMFWLAACTPTKHPFLMVQVCLQNADQLEVLKSELESMARQEGMRYIDRSADTEQEMKRLEVYEYPDGWLLNVGARAADGFSFGASNFGLGPYDVAIGFNGDHANKSHSRLAERLVSKLSGIWKVKVVPEGTGAFPDPRCTSSGDAGELTREVQHPE